MKPSSRWLIVGLGLLTLAGCKNDDLETVTPVTNRIDTSKKDTILTKKDTIVTKKDSVGLKVFAGQDIQVELPVNETTLLGYIYYSTTTIRSIKWTVVSGPATYKFENVTSLTPKLSDLIEGIYKVELAITGTNSFIVRDTVSITVGKLAENPSELVFNNLTWTSPWDNIVVVEDFYNKVPVGKIFKVYIQRHNNQQWIEVKQISLQYNASVIYEYFVEGRPDGAGIYLYHSLVISYYGNDLSDRPSVKVLY